MRRGLYDKGYIINYLDGEQLLQRDKLVYKEDIDEAHIPLKMGIP